MTVHGRPRRILLATICVIAILGLGVGIGRALPHHLKPAERVAPRSEDETRALNVQTVFRADPDQKLIALTFDDGPDPRWTTRVLEILAAHDARATFFVLGSAVVAHPELVEREAREGHEVGIHGWEHMDYLRQSFDDLSGDLARTRDAIVAAGAPAPVVGRPPYGRLDSPALRAYADLSLTAVLWSHHFPGAHAAAIRERNESSASPGMIVLAHDGRSDPTEELMAELDSFIANLTREGYRFVTVTDLLNASEG